MLTYPDKSLQVKKISAEERKKQERMRDVLLLLQQLVEREEITLRLIVDCLYDVGSINLANKKLQNRQLNRITKAIATMLKPVFRSIALIWVKKNLPVLVTDWLEQQVSFKQNS
ncbi:hypothetical protein [Myxosarcina sp. GI1]|uniref:hypothetical protein n=1 Tax=Myxosarcina sp. GI1 TaxID=1541065 RepID=UPI00056A0643|nr:hypothetical protein [Myxosarcina sp. GI1]